MQFFLHLTYCKRFLYRISFYLVFYQTYERGLAYAYCGSNRLSERGLTNRPVAFLIGSQLGLSRFRLVRRKGELTTVPRPGEAAKTVESPSPMTRQRKKLVSPVSALCTVYYRAVLFTAMQYSRGAACCSYFPHRSYEKADIIENIIVESRIKAGSASFLCKFGGGADAAHTHTRTHTSHGHPFTARDNVTVAGRLLSRRVFAIKH